MPSPKTRRYSIEIKDPDNKPVLFTAVDWTDEERLIAVAQIMRLAYRMTTASRRRPPSPKGSPFSPGLNIPVKTRLRRESMERLICSPVRGGSSPERDLAALHD
jgi:hypothetical protein